MNLFEQYFSEGGDKPSKAKRTPKSRKEQLEEALEEHQDTPEFAKVSRKAFNLRETVHARLKKFNGKDSSLIKSSKLDDSESLEFLLTVDMLFDVLTIHDVDPAKITPIAKTASMAVLWAYLEEYTKRKKGEKNE